jgi:hypothetical protein
MLFLIIGMPSPFLTASQSHNHTTLSYHLRPSPFQKIMGPRQAIKIRAVWDGQAGKAGMRQDFFHLLKRLNQRFGVREMSPQTHHFPVLPHLRLVGRNVCPLILHQMLETIARLLRRWVNGVRPGSGRAVRDAGGGGVSAFGSFSANMAAGYADQTGKVGARAGIWTGW